MLGLCWFIILKRRTKVDIFIQRLTIDSLLSLPDGIGGMFSHMRDMMHRMMTSLPSSFGDMDSLPEGAHGRMVVVKSGPGYHSKKTYDIGPDGTKTEVKSCFSII